LTDNYKFLILLFYYDRPEMVKNALKSIELSEYDNFEVAFINDTYGVKGVDITNYIENQNVLSKFKYYDICQTNEEKLNQGGSIFGKYANLAITDSDADIIIMLCDDDALLPNYLSNLNNYFKNNTDHMWAYSKVKYYNPLIENYTESEDNFEKIKHEGVVANLNSNFVPINPHDKCDASQVAFRKDCFFKGNVWFSFPQTVSLDASIYMSMFLSWGSCYPTNFYGQCKGVFSDQLGGRGSNLYEIKFK